MKLMKAAMALALATGLASSAFASAPDERELWDMLKKSAAPRSDGMMKHADRKGTVSPDEVARILDPNIANP